MTSTRISLILFFVSLFASAAWGSPFQRQVDPSSLAVDGEILQVTAPAHFVVDDRLKKNMEFWVRIYTQYGMQQGVIHDSKYIDLVYESVELTQDDLLRAPHKTKRVKALKKKWQQVLLAVHKKQKLPETMNEEEMRVFQMFKDISEPNKFINATHRKRLRFQQGQKDRFLDGLKQSGRYLPIMENIFRREGLPVELTRLPFVESSFNVKARSKVGASGIWQFMRSTAKFYLKMNDAVDERNDPIRATEAAAKLLKLNYSSLGQWPLAVTAYNHGRKGMMRAVRLVGSDDLEDVVSSYRSRTFGFASSNFFCELLAAIEVEKNAAKYFGPIERTPLLNYFEVKIPDYVNLRDLAPLLKLDLAVLRGMNPGLSEQVFSGTKLLPAGYQLRLPLEGGNRESAARVFMAGYEVIPNIYKLRAPIHVKKPRVREVRR